MRQKTILKFRKLFVLVFIIGVYIASMQINVYAQNVKITAFTHVNVIPMDKEIVLADQNVIVNNGIISEIGPSAKVKPPKGAKIVNAAGKFMLPALSDMHVHTEGDAWNIIYPPEKKFTDKEINFSDILFLYIANGITTIDIMFAYPEHLELREKIKNHEIIGPRLILSRMIDADGKGWPSPLGSKIKDANDAKNAVIEMHQQGYDRVKVYSFLTKEEYDTIIAVAKRLKMPVDGHIPFSTSVEYVLKSGQEMIAHIEEIMKFAKSYNPEQVNYYATLLANSDTWVTSALILNKNLNALLADSASQFSKPGTEYLHPMAKDLWAFLYQNIYKPINQEQRQNLTEGYKNFLKPFAYEFYKKGGKLLTGSDALVPSTLPGFSLHEELAELVDAGLSPYEAIKISTTNTFEFLGETETAGTIAKGKIANLLILDENPLENIINTKKIFGVMVQNNWISKHEIDLRLKEIKESYKALTIERSKK
ncbi:MAG: amidohydrolase family protein [Bacteroidales bacterium]